MSAASAVERAGRLVTEGQAAKAIALLETAGNSGDVDALMQLAVWHLAGNVIPRDLPCARTLLRQAVTIGHVDAALMEVAFVANGSGGAADWGAAVALLHNAAVNDPVAAEHLRLIECMNVDREGYPISQPASHVLSKQPVVTRFPSFLTPEECAHVAQVAGPLLCRSEIVDPDTGTLRPHPVRTSDGAIIGPAQEDLVVSAINRRIAVISNTDVKDGESLTVLRYSPGQQYRPHLDALPAATNQRIKTVIIYLNQGFQGGETHFPASGLTITPRGGDAIMFDNCLADGAADPLSLHAGLPVKQGTKWIATRWIRQDPLDPWSYPA